MTMRLTTFEGYVENGRIRLVGDECLPEKARVYVVVTEAARSEIAYAVRSPRLALPEQAALFDKEVVEDPSLSAASGSEDGRPAPLPLLRDPVPVAGVDLADTSRLWELDVEGAAPSGGLGKVGGREPGVDAPSAL